MTKSQRLALRSLLDAATAGPWTVDAGDYYVCARQGDVAQCFDLNHIAEGEANAALIADLRNAAPGLLDYVDELEAENERLRHALSEYVKGDELVYGVGHTERSARARTALAKGEGT